jgi:hypothetical protein
MLCLLIFWESSEPSGARTRTNTEVDLAFPSAKPSLPRGLLLGEPPNVPKNAIVFRKNFVPKFFVYLEETDTRRKQLWHGAGRAAGPPTPSGYSISTHHPMLNLLMNAKSITVVYLGYIREHKNRVKKMMARISRRPRAATLLIYTVQFSHVGR